MGEDMGKGLHLRCRWLVGGNLFPIIPTAPFPRGSFWVCLDLVYTSF